MTETAQLARRASRIDKLIFTAIGVASYAWVTRFVGLSPNNVDWLLRDGMRVFGGDPTTSYLGWEFYRNGSLTAWPPGTGSLLGPDGRASIAISDSIPIMAMFWRVVIGAFGYNQPFQYFGLWMLLSFALQALFAGTFLSRFCAHRAASQFGALMFCLSPILVYRIGYNISLVSQWLIPATLILITESKQKFWPWIVLLTCSVAIHPYLTAMVFICFIAHAVVLTWHGHMSWLTATIRSALLVVGVLAVSYLIGLLNYDVESLSTNGFGDYTTNVVSIVDPAIDDAIAIAPSWSRFNLLPDLPNGEQHQWEGFAYLGTGILLLVMITSLRLLPTLVRNKMWWISIVGSIAVTTVVGRLPLISTAVFALTVGLLAAFVSIKLDLSRESRLVLVVAASLAMAVAVSHRVYVGAALIQLPVPEGLLSPFGFVRVSGRMVWITVYVVMFVVFVLADHAFRRAPKLLAIAVVVVVVALQVADGGEGYQSTRDYMSGPRTAPALTSELWGDIASRYRHIDFVVPRQSPHLDNPRPEQDQTQYSDDFWFAERALWADLGELAVRTKMSLNAFYFARNPANEYEIEAAKLRSIVANNGYREDTLYVFIDAPLWNIAKSTHRESDAVGLLNGVPILAPGLRECTSCALGDLVPVRPISE